LDPKPFPIPSVDLWWVCCRDKKWKKNKQESKEKTSKEADMARKKYGRKTSREADKTRTSSYRIGASEEVKAGEMGREGRKEGSTELLSSNGSLTRRLVREES
jgi:lipopolysaccharide biosynthesis glycosyltransferase